MNEQSIPLPMVLPGKEYIINHIEKGKTDSLNFSGYGIFPGSKIKLLFKSPAKNPAAYEVMGAVLALRYEDSKNIFVSPILLPLQEGLPSQPQ